MELVSVRVAEAPSARGRVRLVGDVAYDDRPREVEQYWFEVPQKYAGSLSVSGNPWLACLLPFAVTRGEPLRLCLPVDPILLANASRLMRIWSHWHTRLRPISLEADSWPTNEGRGDREMGALFSGGIDSFYMVLRDKDESDRTGIRGIEKLLCVWGFDISIDAAGEFQRLRTRLSEAADALGKELIDVATNLRAVRFREADWGRLSHGGALASVGLALERRFHSVRIAATYGGGPLRPWGSHPETDPFFSTGITRILHVGAGIPRIEKTEYVSRSDVAMRSLHVCYRTSSADNCCNCRKCFLAILTLEVLGALDRCRTLPRQALDLNRVRRTYLRSAAYRRLYREVEIRARAAERRDIADAIAVCVNRSRRMKPVLVVLQWLSTKRGIWRIARRLRLRTLADSVQ